ncbi:hypothetical protein [Catenulispora pinisilvae]|uniref:hypothetical protein n=1 Tax=Catenulispora pinisilvae TaxID=2705253 RepID=UPI00189151B4|nr:hypothetical protein [Catenulispora pinisilvae]
MTISRERLYAFCCRLHAAAENNHRNHGFAEQLLMFLPETGPESLVLIPEGIPAQTVLDDFARQTRATAILTTGEAWVSIPGLSTQAMAALTVEDLPRPSQDPDRAEQIVTHAVGIGPDGATTVLTRASTIQRTVFGTMIGEPVDGVPGIRRDGATTALAAALNLPTPEPNRRPRPASNSKDMAMHTPAPPSGKPADLGESHPADPSACPDCSAAVGTVHADACCVAWCAATGRQRRDGCDAGHGCRTDPRRDCRTTWTGTAPGIDDCRRLGWYAVHTPDGWTSTAPETPGAVEDLNRLIADGVWNETDQRYETPVTEPGPRVSGDTDEAS